MPKLSAPRWLLAVALCGSLSACGEDTPEGGDLPPIPVPMADAAVEAGSTYTFPDASGFPDASYTLDDAQVSGDAKVGDAQVSGDGGSKADGGTTLPLLKPKCAKKDSQVMVIGDSFINWISHKFPEQIKTATKADWRMLAVGGTSMGSGGLGRIPNQFDDDIKRDPDAHTILMDGGGNDILVAELVRDPFKDCLKKGSSQLKNCQEIVTLAIDTADELLKRATAAGIRDVVYFFYPYIPFPRLIGGDYPNEILDYALPKVKSFCDSVESKSGGKTRCHFIDMIPVFKGHTPGIDPGVEAKSEADWFNDDIHPNEKGSQGMVDHIWKFMKERCLGQKSGAGCCEE